MALGVKRDDLFAPTPPLEALKMLLSMAVTKGRYRKDAPRKIDMIDISRAFCQADARRDIYVELPPWDKEPGKCARLKKGAVRGTGCSRELERGIHRVHGSLGIQKGKTGAQCVLPPGKRYTGLRPRGRLCGGS